MCLNLPINGLDDSVLVAIESLVADQGFFNPFNWKLG
jgi:hypothetical protein